MPHKYFIHVSICAMSVG